MPRKSSTSKQTQQETRAGSRLPRPRWALVAGVAAIVLGTLFAYIPAMHGGGFIWDDDSYVTANALVQDPGGLLRFWIPHETPQYYPIVFTTFWIEHSLWGLDATGYHIVNVVLHALNALLVWRLARVLNVPGAWLIGAVFALHPVHVESVAWITERKNVLSGCFYLLAALTYLRFDRQRCEADEAGAAGAWGWYGASLLLFAAALLSKSVTCSLPAALILMMLWRRTPLTLARVVPLVPFFALGLLLALNTAAVERAHVGAIGEDFDFSFAERLIIASKALLFYPQKILWPWPLIFIYPRWEIDAGAALSYVPLAIVSLITAAAVVAYVRGWGGRGPALALAFYAGTIVPALGFINVYPMIFSFVADHFQYLASLGVIALIVGGLAWSLGTRRATVALAPVLLILAILTWRQARIYASEDTVWHDTIAKNKRAWMPHANLGANLLREADDAAAAGELDRSRELQAQALEHVARSLELKPNNAEALSNMSDLLLMRGDHAQALDYAERALAVVLRKPAIRAALHDANRPPSPLMADAYFSLGRVQEKLGRTEEALASYAEGLNWDPGDIALHRERARLLLNLNRPEETVPHFEAVVNAEPRNVPVIIFLGEMAERQREYARAEQRYRMALERADTFELWRDAAAKLARMFLTAADPAWRRAADAVAILEEVRQHPRGKSAGVLDLLAAAYAATGRLSEAAATATEAAALARQAGDDELARQIGEHALEYQRKLEEQ